MLIRSQDKKLLINLNNTNFLRIVTGTYQDVTVSRIYAESGIVSSNIPIAEYRTEDRALEVLNQIEQLYLIRMEFDGGPALTGGYVQPNFLVLPTVYQMPPKESEE